MGTTPTYNLRYPELSDPADVPADMHELALDVDSMGVAFDARLDGLEAAVGGSAVALNGVQVRDVGEPNQIRAGRQLAVTDFTDIGLVRPVGLWNLSDLTNLGTGGPLVNKAGIAFAGGINGTANTAAQINGSTAQALYIADTGAADPFRIRTGSWGCWFRTAKRGTNQYLLAKSASGTRMYELLIAATNTISTAIGSTTVIGTAGSTDVADDRWHFVVVTFDGTTGRHYVDGAADGAATGAVGAIPGTTAPLNIGSMAADAGTAATLPHFGRVDEAFVTPDVLSPEQVLNLYCARVPHALGIIPRDVSMAVRRRRRGAALAVADFPAQPVRLHNFTAGALTDQGTGNVPLVPVGGGSIVDVAGADGTKDGAKSFSGAHTGLGATDTGLPAALTSRSFGAWIKCTVPAATAIALAWGSASADAKFYVASTGVLASASGADPLSGPYVADGLWHHVVMVEDNTAPDAKRKMYLDGRVVGTSLVLTSLVLGGANRFRVGANWDGTTPWVGQIDGAFIHAGALTDTQVRALYNTGAPALAPSPKDAADHVEALAATGLLARFDRLEGPDLVDLALGA